MTWTTQLPDKEGWYWWIQFRGTPHIAYVTKPFHEKELWVFFVTGHRKPLSKFHAKWRGPIPLPDEPEARS